MQQESTCSIVELFSGPDDCDATVTNVQGSETEAGMHTDKTKQSSYRAVCNTHAQLECDGLNKRRLELPQLGLLHCYTHSLYWGLYTNPFGLHQPV